MYNLVHDDRNTGINVDAAKAMKGKLITTTTIFDNLVVQGYDPKKTPALVARPAKSQPAPVAVQLRSVAPVAPQSQSVESVASVEKSVQTAETVEVVSTVPMGGVVNPQRLLPDLPVFQQRQPEPRLG